MICYALQPMFPLDMLRHGSRMDEFNVRPECILPDWILQSMRCGKDASINDMLRGGIGFPALKFADPQVERAFDMGCTEELHDLKTLNNLAAR